MVEEVTVSVLEVLEDREDSQADFPFNLDKNRHNVVLVCGHHEEHMPSV